MKIFGSWMRLTLLIRFFNLIGLKTTAILGTCIYQQYESTKKAYIKLSVYRESLSTYYRKRK